VAKIVIGKSGGRNVEIDIDTLLLTRLLIQANSGGGKSYLIRLLCEKLFGPVPIFIADPEGEFATLREKFGFFLVGKGGDVPADPRTAALLAHKLLELRASAVFDLYDLKPADRHRWMRLFVEALMSAPKNLWGPLVFFIDECQLFCPEDGKKGTMSEAAPAIQDLVERGRKRGFCPIPATQRLARLSKHITGQMLNRLVGMTFEDVDVDRAIDLLSVSSADKNEFRKGLRLLEPGSFWGFGRAISKERILIKIGKAQTTHPEPGSSKHAAAPPPAPSKIKALLPRLADLPKEAEEEAKTQVELKAKVRQLTVELAQAKRGQPSTLEVRKVGSPAAAPTIKRVEVPVIKAADIRMLEKIAEKTGARDIQQSVQRLRDFWESFERAVKMIDNMAKIPQRPMPYGMNKPGPMDMVLTPARGGTNYSGHRPGLPSREAITRTRLPAPPQNMSASPRERGEQGDPDGESLDKASRAILTVLANYQEGCSSGKLALLAGYRWSGGFRNSLSELRSNGYIIGSNNETMRITTTGLQAIERVGYDPIPNGLSLVDYWLRHPSFGSAERKILTALKDNPPGLPPDELAAAAGYTWSGGFRNSLSVLRTAGVLIGRNHEVMRLCDELREAADAG